MSERTAKHLPTIASSIRERFLMSLCFLLAMEKEISASFSDARPDGQSTRIALDRSHEREHERVFADCPIVRNPRSSTAKGPPTLNTEGHR
jgi:hypothetical protein